MSAELKGSQGNVALSQALTKIGRAPENQLVIDDSQVSTRHAQILQQGQSHTVMDLGSTNGTFLNEQRLVPNTPQLLKDGDTIRFGETIFTYANKSQYAPTKRASPTPPPASPPLANVAAAYFHQEAVIAPPPPAPSTKDSLEQIAPQENPNSAQDAIFVASAQKREADPSSAPSATLEISRLKATAWLYGLLTVTSVVMIYIYLYRAGFLPSWLGDLASSFNAFNGLIGGLISGGLVTLVAQSSLRHFPKVLEKAHKPIVIVASLITVGILIIIPVLQHNSQIDPYVHKGVLDSTSSRFSAHSWYGFGASCSQNDPFNISQTTIPAASFCFAQDSDYSNFIYEAKMTLLRGDCGGILLRGDSNFATGYVFEICTDGSAGFARYDKNTNNSSILQNISPSSNIKTGKEAKNTLAVKAEGNDFALYVNGSLLANLHDTSPDALTSGQIGVVAQGSNILANIQFDNLRVWVL